jgi:hypothetical protein
VMEPHIYENGRMQVPQKVGLGMQLNEAKLAKYKAETIREPYLDPAKPDWFPAKPQY